MALPSFIFGGSGPTGTPTYESLKRKREIALEEIREEIVKLHPSQSAEDKAAKSALLEELFGTRSWTAVEKFDWRRPR